MTGQKQIERLCRNHDFPLSGVSESGDVLVLEPENLEKLPERGTLNALSAKLEKLGYRYVTFSIDHRPESR